MGGRVRWVVLQIRGLVLEQMKLWGGSEKRKVGAV